jgi:MOSC domain-containing protein YiiM
MSAKATGRILQINISDGGVPKRSIPEGEVTATGLVGDWQRDRRHHGGPTRALCLFSLEHIQALQAEGHPIYPGAIGENVTIAGLDWERMVVGDRLQLGAEVTIEITGTAAPCNNIAGAFTDESFVRVSAKVNPGWARFYARVVQTGRIRPGDVVHHLPAAA